MNFNEINNIINNQNFYFKNQEFFFNEFKFLLSKIDEYKLNNRSDFIKENDFLKLTLVHQSSRSTIIIKIDEFEIYVWVNEMGYSMFNITQEKKYSFLFYKDVIIFLTKSLEGSFKKELYYHRKQLIKSRLIWDNNLYKDAVYMSLKDILLEKIFLKKLKLIKTINYPSFFKKNE